MSYIFGNKLRKSDSADIKSEIFINSLSEAEQLNLLLVLEYGFKGLPDAKDLSLPLVDGTSKESDLNKIPKNTAIHLKMAINGDWLLLPHRRLK